MCHDTTMDFSEQFSRAPDVSPRGITGKEGLNELISNAFPAFVGRQVRTAWMLMRRSIRENAGVFATVSGAMTPAGLHQSCLVPLIQRGFVDVLTTTGANLYHDAHRVIGHRIKEIAPDAGDTRLRRERIVRIYDLGFEERVLLETDNLFAGLLQLDDFQRPMTTPETNYLFGKHLNRLETELGVQQKCLLSSCYNAGVPIFVGAPQDGSIFLNVVRLKSLLGDTFRHDLDAIGDVYTMAALQWLVQSEGQTAIWILGGGVPKNFTLQGEPTLSQIFDLEARGFDIDLQFCVDPVDNGALSSCPAGEGHTWGKVSAECAKVSSTYVHCDVTAIFPFLTHALLAETPDRPHRRLYERLDEARALLDRKVETHRAELLATLDTRDGEPTG